jgi:hypothetical protein
MAAGLGFKDFTTGEVLTAADVDGYLMQGVWVFASAAARDAAVTSPQEGNFAYLKDTNVTTYYTGSAWANLDTTGMTNPMTTTGDIIYSSSGSTPARLGIGSTGNVLTVAGGVPSWAAPAAGGMTLINSGGTTLSGSTTTISSIPSTYKNLYIVVRNYDNTADGNWLNIQFNSDTGTNYGDGQTGVSTNNSYNQTYITLIEDSDNAVTEGLAICDVYDYANTVTWKMVFVNSVTNHQSNAATRSSILYQGAWKDTSAINSVTFLPLNGSMNGGTAFIYGVN